MEQEDYDYDRYEFVIKKMLECMYRDPDDLMIGENISDIPQVKIIFDGYGYDEENDEEGGDKNTESYAVFIHRDAASDLQWEFPEHEMTPWALIHRPAEEICVYVWYNVEEDSWFIPSLEEVNCVDAGHSYSSIMKILNQLAEWYFDEDNTVAQMQSGEASTWPFPSTPRP